MSAKGSLELDLYEAATLTVLYENKGKRSIEVTDEMLKDPHYVSMLERMIAKKLITVSKPLKPRKFSFDPKPEVWLRIEGRRAYEAYLKQQEARRTLEFPPAKSKKMGRKVAHHK